MCLRLVDKACTVLVQVSSGRQSSSCRNMPDIDTSVRTSPAAPLAGSVLDARGTAASGAAVQSAVCARCARPEARLCTRVSWALSSVGSQLALELCHCCVVCCTPASHSSHGVQLSHSFSVVFMTNCLKFRVSIVKSASAMDAGCRTWRRCSCTFS